MQTQTSIYIPKPCHEDWNKMTPTQQGKFCASCSKQVVDFSLMSDQQILNFLSHQSGKLCGRFDAEQLQRPLIETKIKKKKSWWMALTMPLLFLFEKSDAQKAMLKHVYNATHRVNKKYVVVGDIEPVIVKDTTQPSIASNVSERLMGKLAICEPAMHITIKGKVVDENNNPLAYVSVTEKGTANGTITDSIGNFSIKINSYQDSITLTASYIGFSSVDKSIKLSEANNNVVINLKEQVMGLNEVVVSTEALHGIAGGLSICRRVTTFQKIDSSFKKAIGISTVFPNPVLRGNSIHLKIKNTGEYQMQLLDNNSKLIQAEEINTSFNNSTKQIQLSANIAVGIYYLRLINEQTKKSYTQKLIIQ